ncbi:stage II sporulation protein P [Rummeliibacillus stabekisii]|uniref:stage II sporulation protein P n=1 Tax=Rummeliibacillus stabekisii TaxID=241244 RepID=UPI00371F3FE7
MKNKAKIIFGFILLLFLMPIIVEKLGNDSREIPKVLIKDKAKITNATKPILAKKLKTNSKSITNATNSSMKVLLLFTHSHEAFIPIVKKESSKVAVYHNTNNISSFEDIIKKHFSSRSIDAEFLNFDTMSEMEKTKRTFPEAYDVIRPVITSQLHKRNYDLIIDLHRDSEKRNKTSITFKGETFGKLYFVVGENNPNYTSNKGYAQHISTHLNELIPGISKGVLGKKGDNVDGVYNQDLAKNMVLIELGGIENTKDEIDRTLSVLTTAISIVLKDETTS